MVLDMLKDDSISKRVAKCYLLFPTIEHMAETRNGLFFTRIVSLFDMFYYVARERKIHKMYYIFVSGVAYRVSPDIPLLDTLLPPSLLTNFHN